MVIFDYGMQDIEYTPSGTMRGQDSQAQTTQSAIIGIPVSYRTYSRDTPPALTVIRG